MGRLARILVRPAVSLFFFLPFNVSLHVTSHHANESPFITFMHWSPQIWPLHSKPFIRERADYRINKLYLLPVPTIPWFHYYNGQHHLHTPPKWIPYQSISPLYLVFWLHTLSKYLIERNCKAIGSFEVGASYWQYLKAHLHDAIWTKYNWI